MVVDDLKRVGSKFESWLVRMKRIQNLWQEWKNSEKTLKSKNIQPNDMKEGFRYLGRMKGWNDPSIVSRIKIFISHTSLQRHLTRKFIPVTVVLFLQQIWTRKILIETFVKSKKIMQIHFICMRHCLVVWSDRSWEK